MRDTELRRALQSMRSAEPDESLRQFTTRVLRDVVSPATVQNVLFGISVSLPTLNQMREELGMEPYGKLAIVRPNQRVVTTRHRSRSPVIKRRERLAAMVRELPYTYDELLALGIAEVWDSQSPPYWRTEWLENRIRYILEEEHDRHVSVDLVEEDGPDDSL